MEQLCEHKEKLWDVANQHRVATLGLAAIGTLWLSTNVLGKLRSFYKYLLRPSLDIKARYGDGWAVVTGASDGIGKAFAIELARRGFKIGLVARNQEKLNLVADEISKTYGVETKTVVFDFDIHYTKESIQQLREHLSVFDTVSVLVNNVGTYYNKKFAELPSDNMISLINVNVFALTMVAQILIQKLLLNGKRGGIINIGSITTFHTAIGMNVYTATKSYSTLLAKSIGEEYKDNLDVLVVHPAATKTNMSRAEKFLSSYPESVASHSISTLGYESETYGDFRHALRAYFLSHRIQSSIVKYIDQRNIAAANSKAQ